MNSEQDNHSGSYRRFFIVRFYIFVHYRSKDEKINRTQFEMLNQTCYARCESRDMIESFSLLYRV